MSDLLNESQRRSVKIALVRFERNLRLAARWLDGPEEKGILYHRSLNLPAERRQLARKQISAALEQVSEIARALDLEPEGEDASAMIRGNLSVSWANLSDIQSHKLDRYGEVDPKLKSVLDPAVQGLVELSLEIEALFES